MTGFRRSLLLCEGRVGKDEYELIFMGGREEEAVSGCRRGPGEDNGTVPRPGRAKAAREKDWNFPVLSKRISA